MKHRLWSNSLNLPIAAGNGDGAGRAARAWARPDPCRATSQSPGRGGRSTRPGGGAPLTGQGFGLFRLRPPVTVDLSRGAEAGTNPGADMKIALPSDGHEIDAHFGHCQSFTIFTIDENKIVAEETFTPPPGCGCKSNVVPQLAQMGVSVMLAGNMGGGRRERPLQRRDPGRAGLRRRRSPGGRGLAGGPCRRFGRRLQRPRRRLPGALIGGRDRVTRLPLWQKALSTPSSSG